MLDEDSRYYNLKNLTYIKKKGSETKTIIYKERRVIPLEKQFNIVKEIPVLPKERIDNLSYRTLGDSKKFWYICDINNKEPRRLLNEKKIKVGSLKPS